MTCLKKSKFNTSTSLTDKNGKFLIATGGKENDLKIWNLNQTQKSTETHDIQPIFRAKNMPDNWMQLREPVWIMSIDFLDENRVVVGTAHHQVLYFMFDFFFTPTFKLISKKR